MSSGNASPPPVPVLNPAGLDLRLSRVRDLDQDRHFTPGERGDEPLIRAFGPAIYGLASALILEDPTAADGVSAAVFETLQRRWRKLRKRTLLATWFFQTTIVAVRRERKRLQLPKKTGEPVLRALFRLNRLPAKLREIVVLRDVLAVNEEAAARALRMPAKRAVKHRVAALRKIQKEVRKTGTNAEELLTGLLTFAPPDAPDRILAAVNAPTVLRTALVRETVSTLRWLRFRLFLKRVLASVAAVLCLLLLLAATVSFLFTRGYLLPFLIEMGPRQAAKKHPEMLQPPRAWPVTEQDLASARVTPPANWDDLFQMTNIWTVKLSFTPEQWQKIKPNRVPPVNGMIRDKRIILRNPRAKRSGLAGVLGFEFNWVEARLNFSGQYFEKVGVRYRGNGTYLNSLYGPKQSLKLDLRKYVKPNQLAGIHELNFLNTVVDYSFLHDPLAEDLFRELGALGPHTSYAYITVDTGDARDTPRGLFVAVENIDGDYAERRFGTRKAPIFKPVTYDLFQDLGDNWAAYEEIYDLKTKATPEQQQRVIDFAKLVSHASKEEFAQRLPEFLDLDEFAAFLAGHVLLSSYDGFLANGQNYYLYLDPRSNKFGFVPWDQDHAWGDFGHVHRTDERENASIWRPALYDFKFLERVMADDAFKAVYRAKLEKALETCFSKEVLYGKIDSLAQRIRPAVAAESDFRLKRFDTAVSDQWVDGPRDGQPEGPDAPIHQIKRFIVNRVQSVRDQLDGKSKGRVLHGFN